jgi:hypothetical protein
MDGKIARSGGDVRMTDGKKITYKDVMDLERELLDAPELPKAEQSVKDKKEALSVLKKGILTYLKKGYSIQSVIETINGKFPDFEITDADVRKILPKVTKKKRTAVVPAKTNDSHKNKDRESKEGNPDSEE